MRIGISFTVACAFILVTGIPASAGVGDVISSFRCPEGRSIHQSHYVFCVTGVNTLRWYTTMGSLVGSCPLAGLTDPGDAEFGLIDLPRGSGLGIIDGSNRVMNYYYNGSFASSVPITPGTEGYAFYLRSPNYYLLRSSRVYRFSQQGSLVGSFPVEGSGGPIALTYQFNDNYGYFVIVGSPRSGYTGVFTTVGSTVSSFVVPGPTLACSHGFTYGTNYGVVYWCLVRVGGRIYAYQIDLGNTSTSIVPKSVGKIKALFR